LKQNYYHIHVEATIGYCEMMMLPKHNLTKYNVISISLHFHSKWHFNLRVNTIKIYLI